MTAEASILNTSPDLPEQDRPHAPQFCDSSSAEATGSSNSSLRVEKRRLSSSSAQPLTSVQHPDHIPSLPVKKKLRLSDEQRVSTIADAVSTILACLEDDPLREGLVKTPLRYAKALLSLTEGYFKDTKEVVGDAEFDEDHTESVLVRNVDIFSLCEHHLLPFNGYCHVAYVPNGTVIGLSKIARIIDLFSRRLQVQERLTSQIADAVQEATNAQGVMVYISCSHMCMAMRGVRKVGSSTVTTATRGHYANDSELRREFLSSISAATHVR